jgi:dihydrofolate reductase
MLLAGFRGSQILRVRDRKTGSDGFSTRVRGLVIRSEVNVRSVIYGMMVSLDGFIETPTRELDWILIDEELHKYVNDQNYAVGTYVYGRRMYELMAGFWPTADADPSAPDVIVEYARIWRPMPKVVFSRTLDKVEWNARLVREDFEGEMIRLKQQTGKDIEVSGADLASAAMRLGLIDEYQLYVQPVVLGSGTRMFPALDDRINLRLLETHTFRSGVILLRYRRAE